VKYSDEVLRAGKRRTLAFLSFSGSNRISELTLVIKFSFSLYL